MKGTLTVIAIVLVGILTIVTGIGCANTEEVATNEPKPMVVDVYEPVTWEGCEDGKVVMNGKVYPTHDLTTNIHVYGFTATKRVECDIVNGEEGMWVESAGMERFHVNGGGFTAHR